MNSMPELEDKYGPIEFDQTLKQNKSDGYERHWSSKKYKTREDDLDVGDVIPAGIQMRHLMLPKTKSSIFLVGVDR